MNFLRRFQRHLSSFLDPDDLWWLLGGIVFHTGLISAYMPLFVLGLYCFPNKVKHYTRAVLLLSLSSGISILWQGPSYHAALSQIYDYPCIHCFGTALSWLLYWFFWSVIYLGLRYEKSFLLASLWMWGSGYWHELCYLGFTHVGPMLVDNVWAPTIPAYGEIAVFLFIWLSHMMRKPVLRQGIWFVPLVMAMALPSPKDNPIPPWLDEIEVFPEGIFSRGKNPNAVRSHRIYDNQGIYYAAIGEGDVHGMSIKRHLVPLVEGGYRSYDARRVLKYFEHSFVVLVCNDALFSDIREEVQSSEAVVVISWLDGVDGSPLKRYFFKRLRYIQLKFQKPVRLVDSDYVWDV